MLVLASIARPLEAQTTPPIQAAPSDAVTAPVVVDGRELFHVRGVSAYPAENRARDIAAQIEAAAADRSVSKDSLQLEPTPDGIRIIAGDRAIMTVVDADSNVERVKPHVLAQILARRITQAIDDFRVEREPAVLGRHAFYTLAATLALLLALLGARRTVRGVHERMEARYKGKVRGLSIQSFHFVRAEQVWRVVRALVNSAWIVGLLVLAYFYLHYALSLFPWTRGLAQDLLQLVSDPLQKIGWGIIQKIPDLVFIAILIAVTRYVLFLIELFFTAIENETIKLHEFDPMWAKPTYRLVRAVVIIFALVVAYPYIPGSGSEAFKGVSLFVGVLVSLGSSSLIGHIIAGYTMTYRRTFKKGDRVRIGQHLGDVEHSRLTATYLRTPKNEIVIVPNSKIINEEVVNYSTLARERGLILHTTVDVGYDAPWRQVEAMLLEAAGRTPGVFREPKPYVLQKALGQFAVTYEINAYCDQPNIMGRLYAQLHRNILDLFNEYGVQIMTPSYEGDPEIAKVVPLDRFHVAPASESDRPIDVAEDSEDPGAPSFRKAS